MVLFNMNPNYLCMALIFSVILLNSIPLGHEFVHALSSPSISTTSSFWTLGTNMPTPRSELAGAVLDGKIYIVGGYAYNEKKDIVEIYDPEIDKWSSASSLPEPLDHPAAAAYNGKLYVVGGSVKNNVPSNKLFIYDPNNNKWNEGEPMPTARRALTANFIDGILYAVGGQGFLRDTLVTNEAYDPTTNTWKEKEPMPTPRHHSSSSVVDGKLYIIGGRQTKGSPSYTNLNSNEMYDPKSDTWTTNLEPMPTKRSGLAAVSIKHEIYVLGGEERKGEVGKTFRNNEKYDTKSDTWTIEPSLPTARHGLAALIIDDKIYAIGGGPRFGALRESFSGENEIFNIISR
jgi:N-acetylneuraminic acid mutarotase